MKCTMGWISPTAPSSPRPGLSQRYISDRKLPDKAIDLVDEAASRIRMEMVPNRGHGPSAPASDSAQDRTEAVRKDKDSAAEKQLQLLHQEIDRVEREYADLEEVWKAEKATLLTAAQIKSELEQARVELEVAHRATDLTRMSELQYGVIPELEKRLSQAGAADTAQRTLLRNKVTGEEVAEVVSKWTGIPVSKMLEGDREKLLRMESALHARVIGQEEAVVAVSNAVRRSRAGLSDPNRPNGSFLFLGSHRCGQNRTVQGLGGVSV